MNIEYHKWWSNHLNQDMEIKVYGYTGKPILVFPTQGGRFYEYEDFGMVEACHESIDAGKIQFYTVDSIDNQSWANWNVHPTERARRHEDYDQYITQEIIPFIHHHSQWQGKYFTTGCSMGAYHAPNFFFRHPDVFDGVIALSGILRLNLFIGNYMDDIVYLNTPLVYLRNLTDETYLNAYRQSIILICSGQGAWEGPMLEDARELKAILDAKQVPCWVDFWGNDVNHDWPWWRRMMPYFLGKLDFIRQTYS